MLIPEVTIQVFGVPAPQGSKKFVGLSKAGRGIMVESSAKVRPWRQDVVAAAIDWREKNPWFQTFDCPVIVTMAFTLRKPLSAPKKRKSHPKSKPDLSKLIRSTEDALTTAGIWSDDARVVHLTALKTYPGEHSMALDRPGVLIYITTT